MVKRIGHRGYSEKYPENTMMAFIKAYERGFDGVETDVHMTLDQELVLIHDETINRTSNGKGYVKDQTLSQLREYNFSCGHAGDYPIPTLRELLEFAQGKNFLINIELKTDVIHYPDIETKVIQLVKEHGMEAQVQYSSFYLPSILKLKELQPQAYVGYLVEFYYAKRYEELLTHHISCFHIKHTFVKAQRIEELKKQGITLAVWTVPHQKKYDVLKQLGVEYAICNDYFE